MHHVLLTTKALRTQSNTIKNHHEKELASNKLNVPLNEAL